MPERQRAPKGTGRARPIGVQVRLSREEHAALTTWGQATGGRSVPEVLRDAALRELEEKG